MQFRKINQISWFKKAVAFLVCGTMIVASSTIALAWDNDDHRKWRKGYKNVIVLVPDGCDETVQTVARWYKGEDLQVDKMQNAAVKIHMANSVITGSAAAATAFASGHKTTVRFLGIGPRTEDLLTGFEPTAEPYAPVASILEAAKLKGMATGIVSTSRVTHATPAAFACHIQDRGWDNDIMEHMVYNDVDVIFGGGARHLIPSGVAYTTTFDSDVTWSGRRTDGENLMDVLLERGYQFVDSKYGMEALTHGKVWGLFDDSHMQPDIDRQHFAEHEPSIAEMTAKAIELLSQNKDGFFLMVEGSQVDWAGHNNDPIYMTTDFLAFDDAVKVACDFADEEGRTLVLAYPDHNTGGMKIGHYYTDVSYTATTIEDLVEPLKGMTMSANGVARDVIYDNEGTEEDPIWVINKDSLIASLADNWAIDATEDDINEIIELEPVLGLSYALARVISKNHTVIGWTTHGHNGETVPVWVYGADAPVGTIDNTELAVIAANAMNANLNKATRKLYMDLGSVTDDYTIVNDDGVIVNDGGVIVVDEDGNPVFDGNGNLTLMVGKAELPISKDYMIYKGRERRLPGLTVYAPATGNVYLSKRALKILRLL